VESFCWIGSGDFRTSFVDGIGQGVTHDDPLALESKRSIVAAEIFYAIGAIRSIYYWLRKETDPTFPSTWTYVAPVIAKIVGAIFLDEKLTTFKAGMLT
jgi:drug/metabolite transporter (DMT)-like permease